MKENFEEVKFQENNNSQPIVDKIEGPIEIAEEIKPPQEVKKKIRLKPRGRFNAQSWN